MSKVIYNNLEHLTRTKVPNDDFDIAATYIAFDYKSLPRLFAFGFGVKPNRSAKVPSILDSGRNPSERLTFPVPLFRNYLYQSSVVPTVPIHLHRFILINHRRGGNIYAMHALQYMCNFTHPSNPTRVDDRSNAAKIHHT